MLRPMRIPAPNVFFFCQRFVDSRILVEHTTSITILEITPTETDFSTHWDCRNERMCVYHNLCQWIGINLKIITTHGVPSFQTNPCQKAKNQTSAISHHSMDYLRISSLLNHSGTCLSYWTPPHGPLFRSSHDPGIVENQLRTKILQNSLEMFEDCGQIPWHQSQMGSSCVPGRNRKYICRISTLIHTHRYTYIYIFI